MRYFVYSNGTASDVLLKKKLIKHLKNMFQITYFIYLHFKMIIFSTKFSSYEKMLLKGNYSKIYKISSRLHILYIFTTT